MHTVWPEVRSSRIPARAKTRTSSDHRGGYRARSPVAGALRRLLVCMNYTSMWSFDMSIIFSFSFTFGWPSCSGPGLCPFFLKKSIICIFMGPVLCHCRLYHRLQDHLALLLFIYVFCSWSARSSFAGRRLPSPGCAIPTRR